MVSASVSGYGEHKRFFRYAQSCQKDHFSIYYIKSFDLVTVFAETKSVTVLEFYVNSRKIWFNFWFMGHWIFNFPIILDSSIGFISCFLPAHLARLWPLNLTHWKTCSTTTLKWNQIISEEQYFYFFWSSISLRYFFNFSHKNESP